jgi:DNA-entry nuclease
MSPARRRRRSSRGRGSRGRGSRSRGSRGRLSPLALVATLLVLVGLWVVGADVVRSLPPQIKKSLPPELRQAPTTAPPRGGGGAERGDDLASNVRTIRRLRGAVSYGRVDPRTGQRSGITATITPAMVAAADRDELGSEPDESIRPPGLAQLPSRNHARGHLLGRQLGGSGQVSSNLIAMYQSRANSPVMRDYETMVADAVQAGETVRYEVRPLYRSASDRGAPIAVRIRASGNHGFRMDVEIANTPQATVKEYVPPPSQS